MFAELAARVAVADDVALVQQLQELEERRRAIEAETAAVLAELERRRVHRVDGHATMWGLLRSSVGWSDRECRERMRVAHLCDRFAGAADGLLDARTPVANLTEIARAAANPRCGEAIDDQVGHLLNLAERMEFDDLKLVVRQWERLADADGAHRDTSTNHDLRNAHVVVWDGVGHAAAQWGELDGLANHEIFEQYVRAEWETDWAATLERYGDDATAALMPRTDAQRRADAMTAIFRDAASTAPGARPPEPVVNIHVDHHTFVDLMVEAELFPERFVDPFEDRGVLASERRCSTDTGQPVDPHTVLQLAIESYVRVVIHDDHGVPIHWGRTRRLFTGAARAAVLSLSTRCTHPGCRVRARRSQADHTTDFAHGGVTDPANGGPRCRRHNLIKNRGFTVTRDQLGAWHTYRPDGTEI
jgi:hypothetical protein